MKDLDALQEKITELRNTQEKLTNELQTKIWNTKRQQVRTRKGTDLPNLIDSLNTPIKEKLISQPILTQYRQWYSLGKSILEVNGDSDSIKEFTHLYTSIQQMTNSGYISEEGQIAIIDILEHQLRIIEALPSYLEGKAYNLKLTIASTLMGDELKEARVLLKNGFIRAAGALAAVVLERHLKLNFDNTRPPIKYGEKVMLGQLIQKAEDHDFYETTTIQKLKYLNTIRISCDHDKKHEPKESEVQDLIEQTDKLIPYTE